MPAPSLSGEGEGEGEDEEEQQYRAELSIKIVRATGLQPSKTNTSGLCSAVVLLAMGPQEVRSVVAPPGNSPEWNELTLLTWDGFQVLQVQVADASGKGAGSLEVLGETYLELESLGLQSNQTWSQSVDLPGSLIKLQLEITLREN